MNTRRSFKDLLSAGFLFAALFIPAGSVFAETPIEDQIATIKAELNRVLRNKALYELGDNLRGSRTEISDEVAEVLAHLLADVLLDPDSAGERSLASDLLTTHAHPAVADRLLQHLITAPDDPLRVHDTIKTVLARLRDRRIYETLVADLSADTARRLVVATERLVGLGDERAIARLETLMADTTLAERLGESLVARRLAAGKEISLAIEVESSQRHAAEVYAAVDRALRQLRFQAESGVVCGFDLPQSALDVLTEQGFVILPLPRNELFEWYSDEYPMVTTDFVYHTWMILVRAAVDELENLWLDGALASLCVDLMRASESRDASFFAVPAVLLGAVPLADCGLDDVDRTAVEMELALIADAASVQQSPVLDRVEDYTEYVPRGRFAGERSGYFQALVWMGRAVFRANDAAATRQALRTVRALYTDPQLTERYARIDTVLNVLGGPRDDPGPDDYLRLAERVADQPGVDAITAVLGDSRLESAFLQELLQWPPPKIHTGTGADREDATGLRLLGQRYTRDAHLFQHLLEMNVWPVSGLHVLGGLLGSERAEHHLGGPVPLPVDLPAPGGVDLVEGFFACHAPLFGDASGLPEVFRSDAWADKVLNAAMGAWAETRHAAAPYAKSAHIYAGISGMMDSLHGCVEPYPEFFAQLADRATALHGLLERLGFYETVARAQAEIEAELDADYGPADRWGHRKGGDHRQWQEKYERELATRRLDASRLPEFITITRRLEKLAVKTRDRLPQNVNDGLFLKSLADRMRHLSFNKSNLRIAEESMARVTDVAVEYFRGEVLEAGVGRALPIYVVVEDGERKIVCRGGVYSYYEFVQPIVMRLDDTVWDCCSTRLDGLKTAPWLQGAANLIHSHMLSREDLVSMLGLAKWVGGRAMHTRPWVPSLDSGLPRAPWVGAHASASDVDVLLRLASDDNVNDGARLMATSELARHAGVPEARAFFTHLADEFIALGIGPSQQPDPTIVMQLYFTLMVIADSADPIDRERLVGLAELVRSVPAGNTNWEAQRVCLEALLKRYCAGRVH